MLRTQIVTVFGEFTAHGLIITKEKLSRSTKELVQNKKRSLLKKLFCLRLKL